MKDYAKNITDGRKHLGNVVFKGFKWLDENFHKLTETNKMKILVTLIGKSMAEKHEHKMDLDLKTLLRDSSNNEQPRNRISTTN